MPVLDVHEQMHDATFVIAAEESLEAYLEQALERYGEPYNAHTQALAKKPGTRFYRVLMD